MTDLRKAAKMALEALDCLPWQASPIAREATQALRQALAQPEQRPVGTYEGVMETMLSLQKGTFEQQQIYTHMKDKLLYTAPPKREWVEITKGECDELFRSATDHIEYAYAIEAKLKEKNT